MQNEDLEKDSHISERVEFDGIAVNDRVTRWDIIALVISITSHCCDVIFDYILAFGYLRQNFIPYFWFTLGFILVPAFINTAFSIRMYYLDGRKNSTSRKAIKWKITYVLIMVFQFAPILRYIDALRYSLKSRKAERNKNIHEQRINYELMLKEESDVALLRVFECFLESAPQLILQIVLFLLTYDEKIGIFPLQFASMLTSFISMSWSMASYQRAIRFALQTKNNMSWSGTVTQFIWHFLVTVSRILSISVAATTVPIHAIFALVFHWFGMTMWLKISEKTTNFCDQKQCCDVIFFAIFGLVYIFTYVSITDGPTKMKYFLFYTISFVENVVFNYLWYSLAWEQIRMKFFFMPLIYFNNIAFLIGIVFMILFYTFLHPSIGRGSRCLMTVHDSKFSEQSISLKQ